MRPRDEIVTDESAHVPQGTESGRALGHEADRPQMRPILIGAAVLAAVLAVGVVVPTLLEVVLESREERSSPRANPLLASAGRELPPQPRLQVNPWRDITEYRTAQEEILTSYGWVDRQAGIVRIPIERAMEMVAAGHSPAPEAAK